MLNLQMFVVNHPRNHSRTTIWNKPLTHPEGLPGANDSIVEGVHNVEHVRLLETHLSLVCLVVVEVGFDVEGVAALELKMSGDEYMIMRIDSRP